MKDSSMPIMDAPCKQKIFRKDTKENESSDNATDVIEVSEVLQKWQLYQTIMQNLLILHVIRINMKIKKMTVNIKYCYNNGNNNKQAARPTFLYEIVSNMDSICAGSSTGVEIGWEARSASRERAGCIFSTMNCSCMAQPGSATPVPKFSMKLAKPSLSHRSLHLQRILWLRGKEDV